LLGNDHDAADAVHDAFLRDARAADTYAGGNARAWWLAIVRNCCLTRLAVRGKEQRNVALDQLAREQGREAVDALLIPDERVDVGDRIDDARRRSLVAHSLKDLPAEFREVLVLREIEELSYREIADVLHAPIGTVMSRLARGRALLHKALNPTGPNEVKHEL